MALTEPRSHLQNAGFQQFEQPNSLSGLKYRHYEVAEPSFRSFVKNTAPVTQTDSRSFNSRLRPTSSLYTLTDASGPSMPRQQRLPSTEFFLQPVLHSYSDPELSRAGVDDGTMILEARVYRRKKSQANGVFEATSMAEIDVGERDHDRNNRLLSDSANDLWQRNVEHNDYSKSDDESESSFYDDEDFYLNDPDYQPGGVLHRDLYGVYSSTIDGSTPPLPEILSDQDASSRPHSLDGPSQLSREKAFSHLGISKQTNEQIGGLHKNIATKLVRWSGWRKIRSPQESTHTSSETHSQDKLQSPDRTGSRIDGHISNIASTKTQSSGVCKFGEDTDDEDPVPSATTFAEDYHNILREQYREAQDQPISSPSNSSSTTAAARHPTSSPALSSSKSEPFGLSRSSFKRSLITKRLRGRLPARPARAAAPNTNALRIKSASQPQRKSISRSPSPWPQRQRQRQHSQYQPSQSPLAPPRSRRRSNAIMSPVSEAFAALSPLTARFGPDSRPETRAGHPSTDNPVSIEIPHRRASLDPFVPALSPRSAEFALSASRTPSAVRTRPDPTAADNAHLSNDSAANWSNTPFVRRSRPHKPARNPILPPSSPRPFYHKHSGITTWSQTSPASAWSRTGAPGSPPSAWETGDSRASIDSARSAGAVAAAIFANSSRRIGRSVAGAIRRGAAEAVEVERDLQAGVARWSRAGEEKELEKRREELKRRIRVVGVSESGHVSDTREGVDGVLDRGLDGSVAAERARERSARLQRELPPLPLGVYTAPGPEGSVCARCGEGRRGRGALEVRPLQLQERGARGRDAEGGG